MKARTAERDGAAPEARYVGRAATVTRTLTLTEESRTFGGWATVELVDKEGDRLPIDEAARWIRTLVEERGGTLIDGHSNRPVGTLFHWERRTKQTADGPRPGIWVEGVVYAHTPVDDEVWRRMTSGEQAEFSVGGGVVGGDNVVCEGGQCWREPAKLYLWELSTCRTGTAINPEATLEVVNPRAKARTDEVRRMNGDGVQEQWEEPTRYRDMLAHEMFGRAFDELSDDEQFAVCEEAGRRKAKHGVKPAAKQWRGPVPTGKERPPKAWWDACMGRAEKFASDPAAYCGALWFHGPAEMRTAFGKASSSADGGGGAAKDTNTSRRIKGVEEALRSGDPGRCPWCAELRESLLRAGWSPSDVDRALAIRRRGESEGDTVTDPNAVKKQDGEEAPAAEEGGEEAAPDLARRLDDLAATVANLLERLEALEGATEQAAPAVEEEVAAAASAPAAKATDMTTVVEAAVERAVAKALGGGPGRPPLSEGGAPAKVVDLDALMKAAREGDDDAFWGVA